jgi:hypothetical protein
MTKLFITILITVLASNNLALGAPASSIRGAKTILEGDLQNHRLKPKDINAELYARDPWSFRGIWRGAKKAVGRVQQYIGTATKIAGTASKIAAFIPRELEEVSEREYHDELFDRELDKYLFEREYDEELVRDFNDAVMDGLD